MLSTKLKKFPPEIPRTIDGESSKIFLERTKRTISANPRAKCRPALSALLQNYPERNGQMVCTYVYMQSIFLFTRARVVHKEKCKFPWHFLRCFYRAVPSAESSAKNRRGNNVGFFWIHGKVDAELVGLLLIKSFDSQSIVKWFSGVKEVSFPKFQLINAMHYIFICLCVIYKKCFLIKFLIETAIQLICAKISFGKN